MATAVIKTHYSICHKQFHMQLHSHDAYAATPLPLFARTGRHVSPLVQKTHTREVSLFSSPGKFRPSCAFWINCTRGERTASTHELRPVPFPCATCRPPPMQPCCDACIVSPC